MTKKRFSISINDNLNDWELALDLLHDEYFEGIELPACYLNNPKLPNLLEKSNMQIMNVVDLVSSSISRTISDQSPKVQKNIFEHIDSIISKKYDFHFYNFTLDLGLDTQKENALLSKINFLKQFTHTLFSKNMTMTLPVRIPDTIPLNEYGKYILEIMRNTMFSGYKICLNLYPHKINKSDNPEDILHWYDFDLKTVRIIYEPETGNYITKKLLDHWIKPLDAIDFQGNVIFCPKTSNFVFFENEIRKLTGLIDKLDL